VNPQVHHIGQERKKTSQTTWLCNLITVWWRSTSSQHQ